jgi:hypothetical protein
MIFGSYTAICFLSLFISIGERYYAGLSPYSPKHSIDNSNYFTCSHPVTMTKAVLVNVFTFLVSAYEFMTIILFQLHYNGYMPGDYAATSIPVDTDIKLSWQAIFSNTTTFSVVSILQHAILFLIMKQGCTFCHFKMLSHQARQPSPDLETGKTEYPKEHSIPIDNPVVTKVPASNSSFLNIFRSKTLPTQLKERLLPPKKSEVSRTQTFPIKQPIVSKPLPVKPIEKPILAAKITEKPAPTQTKPMQPKAPEKKPPKKQQVKSESSSSDSESD